MAEVRNPGGITPRQAALLGVAGDFASPNVGAFVPGQFCDNAFHGAAAGAEYSFIALQQSAPA